MSCVLGRGLGRIGGVRWRDDRLLLLHLLDLVRVWIFRGEVELQVDRLGETPLPIPVSSLTVVLAFPSGQPESQLGLFEVDRVELAGVRSHVRSES